MKFKFNFNFSTIVLVVGIYLIHQSKAINFVSVISGAIGIVIGFMILGLFNVVWQYFKKRRKHLRKAAQKKIVISAVSPDNKSNNSI